MKTALLIVDVQKYFLKDAPRDFSSRIADHITDNVYGVLVFTVFKNNPESNFVKTLKWEKCFRNDDTKLPEILQQYVSEENLFIRSTYSGFETTDLHVFLGNHGIHKVVLCGVDSEACVLATAFSAFDKGYAVEINFDLTYSSGSLTGEAKAIADRTLKPKI